MTTRAVKGDAKGQLLNVMYSGALIGARIQGSGFSFLRRSQTPGLKTQWSIQNVRGKVTARCLWHACKALMAGICLIMIGAVMATVGYYADELATEEQTQGNITIKIKNSTRGFHLNNLSYVGPVIMGFGGFVIVTACVMTFEARDSAAKIVPARFRNKLTAIGKTATTSNGATPRLPTNCDTWDRGSDSLQTSALEADGIERGTITRSFIEFSKNVQNSIDSGEYLGTKNKQGSNLKRSPSAPTLLTEVHQQTLFNLAPSLRCKNQLKECLAQPNYPAIKRLQVNFLPRQALSVDNPRNIYNSTCSNCIYNMEDLRPAGTHSDLDLDGEASASVHKTDSEASMTMDLHLPDCSITLTVKDESKRPKHSHDQTPPMTAGQPLSNATSPKVNAVAMANRSSPPGELGRRETARRRPLMRQSKVEHVDSDSESNNKEDLVEPPVS